MSKLTNRALAAYVLLPHEWTGEAKVKQVERDGLAYVIVSDGPIVEAYRVRRVNGADVLKRLKRHKFKPEDAHV